ncbi:MAG: hypothetical protein ACE5GU_10025 [Candidatus Scalinduaceae bacterium]
MTRRRFRILGMLLISVVLCTREASAHRDDYLNETLVYLTLERSELEAEYWFDHGRQSGDHRDFSRHNTAFEWGIIDSWMVDGRVAVVSEEGKGTNFDSARLESRYRFLDEGVLPVDIAASFEVNSERESDDSTTVGIEPRVILSRDFGEKLNLTVNLSEEIPLDSESPAFLVAFGSRFNWTKMVRVGSEFQYNFDEHSGSVIPQLWLAFPRDVTVKIGYSIGVDQEPDDFVRAALEVGF